MRVRRLSTDCQTKSMTGNHNTILKHLSGGKKSPADIPKGGTMRQVKGIRQSGAENQLLS